MASDKSFDAWHITLCCHRMASYCPQTSGPFPPEQPCRVNKKKQILQWNPQRKGAHYYLLIQSTYPSSSARKEKKGPKPGSQQQFTTLPAGMVPFPWCWGAHKIICIFGSKVYWTYSNTQPQKKKPVKSIRLPTLRWRTWSTHTKFRPPL